MDKKYCDLPIFRDLTPDQWNALEVILECKTYTQKTIIFDQDEPAGHLYVLLEGEVVIRYKPYDGPPLTVAHIAPGGVFGWSTALGRETHTSAAVAVELCQVVRLSRQTMTGLSFRSPLAGEILLEKLAGAIVRQNSSEHTYPNFDLQMQEHVALSLQELFATPQDVPSLS